MDRIAKLIITLICAIAGNIAIVQASYCFTYHGYWGPWTACDRTCGGGWRTRRCVYDNTHDRERCNVDCNGFAFFNDKCNCPPNGTTGACCKDIVDCHPDTCRNGGICHDLLGGFKCACPPGTTGSRCDDILECASAPCKNGGTCHEFVNSFYCECPRGTFFPDCKDLLDCASNPCKNGGTCLEQIGGYDCQCPTGTTGKDCEDVLECASNPCQNGGTCIDLLNMYNCLCAHDYAGDNCETWLFSPHDEICRSPEPCYIVFKISLSWEDAQSVCEARGGHLAVPNNMQEETFLEGYLTSMKDRFPKSLFWIGGKKSYDNLPTWVGGDAVSVFRWPSGAPEDIPGTQCLVMDESFNYYWQARPCDMQTFFICEEKVPFTVTG